MIRRYKEEDYEEVMSWMDKRKMKRIHPKVLSNVGLISPGVAAVWVYVTDSDIVYIENLVSNPDVKDKEIEITVLIDTAIQAAKKMGFKFFMAVTDNKTVIKVGARFGAKIKPNQSLITLQLH